MRKTCVSVSSIVPKFFSLLREPYTREMATRDVTAGVVVGIVALPLAIAFAVASGVRPEQGLYTAIIAGFLISALGGSRFQIGGPTGAFIVLTYALVQEFGYDGLAVITMLAGLMLVVFGFSRLGTLIRYVPYPVTVGFTSGIAIVIASSQIKDGLGLTMDSVPVHFVAKWVAYADVLTSINPWSVVLSVGAVCVLVYLPCVFQWSTWPSFRGLCRPRCR